MMEHTHEVRECMDPNCRFRFPMARNERIGERCPRCLESTRLVRRLTITGDQNLPPMGHPLLPLSGMLDNLRSTLNVGAIFRSADGAGCRHLYLCGITATPEQGGLTKTALGAEQSVAWSHHNNSMDLARQLVAAGSQLWALEAGGEGKPLFEVTTVPFSLVLLVGNEVTGLDPDLLECCAHRIEIPMHGRKRSLNVATSFAVATFYLAEQMRRSRQ